MDDELDELIVAVRADTQAFAADMRTMRGTFDTTLVDSFEQAGRVLERGLLAAIRKGSLGFEDLQRMASAALDQIAAQALQLGLENLFAAPAGSGIGHALGGAVGALLGLPGRATGGLIVLRRFAGDRKHARAQWHERLADHRDIGKFIAHRHQPVIGGHDRHLTPVELSLSQHLVNGHRRLAARKRDHSAAARINRAFDDEAHIACDGLCHFGRAVIVPPFDLGHKILNSCCNICGTGGTGRRSRIPLHSYQVTPSRSVSAMLVDGPQLPDVYFLGVMLFAFHPARI